MSNAPKPKRVLYTPLFVLVLAVAFLGVVVDVGMRRARLNRDAKRAFEEIQQGCGRGDQASCGQLLLVVERPCLERRDARACLWYGYLNEVGIGFGYERADVMAAAHFGVACAKGLPEACTILRFHYEHPTDPCPWAVKLNPLGDPLRCSESQKSFEKVPGVSRDARQPK